MAAAAVAAVSVSAATDIAAFFPSLISLQVLKRLRSLLVSRLSHSLDVSSNTVNSTFFTMVDTVDLIEFKVDSLFLDDPHQQQSLQIDLEDGNPVTVTFPYSTAEGCDQLYLKFSSRKSFEGRFRVSLTSQKPVTSPYECFKNARALTNLDQTYGYSHQVPINGGLLNDIRKWQALYIYCVCKNQRRQPHLYYNRDDDFRSKIIKVTPASSSRTSAGDTLIADKLRGLSDTFSDMTLVCGNVSFKAHRCIMAAWSPVFEKMLADQKFVEARNSKVTIDDSEPEVLRLFLDFMYGKVVSDDDVKKHQVGLFQISHKYDVQELLQKVEAIIVTNVNEKTFDKVIVLGERYERPDIKAAVAKFVEENRVAILDSDVWKRFVNGLQL